MDENVYTWWKCVHSDSDEDKLNTTCITYLHMEIYMYKNINMKAIGSPCREKQTHTVYIYNRAPAFQGYRL